MRTRGPGWGQAPAGERPGAAELGASAGGSMAGSDRVKDERRRANWRGLAKGKRQRADWPSAAELTTNANRRTGAVGLKASAGGSMAGRGRNYTLRGQTTEQAPGR